MKDQFACSQGSCRITAVVFDLDGLVFAIESFLSECGARCMANGLAQEGGVGRSSRRRLRRGTGGRIET